METLERELNRARRYGHTLSFLMFDLDYFKSVNDQYGHESGDKVLQGVVEVCANCLREVDDIGRVGGEEFAVLMPDTRLTGAIEVAERLRCAVERLAVSTQGGNVSVTISIGVAETAKGDMSVRELLRAADKALYAAKRDGRNKVVSAT